jgi:hypothetical protein
MTPTPFYPETVLSFCARLHLAKELGVKPDELAYIGPIEGSGYVLLMFNVDRPGSDLHRTTRSVKVEL